MTGIMTSLIGLAFALYFGPTQEQISYCIEEGRSYETWINPQTHRVELTPEAKEKAEICKKILNIKDVKDELKYY